MGKPTAIHRQPIVAQRAIETAEQPPQSEEGGDERHVSTDLETATMALEDARARRLRQTRRARPHPPVSEFVPPSPEQLAADYLQTQSPEDSAPSRGMGTDELTPVQRSDLSDVVAAAIADDAVEKLDALVDLLNRVRARRNGRRAARGRPERELVRFDRAGLRELIAEGAALGVESGLVWVLEQLLVGYRAESPYSAGGRATLEPLAPAPQMRRLHEDERRWVVQTPPILF